MTKPPTDIGIDAATDALDDCYTWLNTPVGAILKWHVTAAPDDHDTGGENYAGYPEHFNASSVAVHVILVPGFWIDEGGHWRSTNPYSRTGTVLALDGWSERGPTAGPSKPCSNPDCYMGQLPVDDNMCSRPCPVCSPQDKIPTANEDRHR
jgi:hypothetical protein